jgi:60 kDa SS-A/Ro ribonucleoprotein
MSNSVKALAPETVKAKREKASKFTPQSQPIPGSTMVPNNAGGYTFPLDDWARLDRFLILGTEGGTYYVKEQALTQDNAQVVRRLIEKDGERVVERIVQVSDQGKAYKNDPALYALAMAATYGTPNVKALAMQALSKVARIGTHWFHFATFIHTMRGWGRGLRQGIAGLYLDTPSDKLAYQVVKYPQRDGWSHRDLLRLSHPKTTDSTRNAILHYAVKGWEGVGEEPHPDPVLRLIWAAERAKRATDEADVVRLIRDYRLPREALPTQWLKSRVVWEALLEDMPLTALIRNLATMTRVGLLGPLSDGTRQVVQRLSDTEALRKARIHPIGILAALKTYAQGHGERSDNTWTPVAAVTASLDSAFYQTFQNAPTTGKRWLLALDVSGSMSMGDVSGVVGLTPRDASAAMALVTAATEPVHEVVGFTSGSGGMWGATALTRLAIHKGQRLDAAIRTVSNLSFNKTNCALPMLWATKNRVPVDVFVVYTDSETWAGQVQPVQALQEYRQRMGIGAKLVVVGMTSNGFTLADPNDAGMLDVVGFDPGVPTVLSDFAVA